MKKIALCLALALLLCAILCACSEPQEEASSGGPESGPESSAEESGMDFSAEGNETEMKQYETSNPVVAIKIKDYGVVVAELYPDIAPQTVYNFIYLIKNGFYDNNTIHRMLPGFMLQGGDPRGNGTGGPGYCIKGEFTANGFENNLKHTPGVLSMARANPYDSAGSQFFIMLGNADWLDGSYAAFGKVIEGMEVCREIEKIPYYNTKSGKLTENLTIEKVVVDTKGVDYPEPEKLPEY